MAKFDYCEFSTGCGHDRQLVLHAKKFTIDDAIKIFESEYEHLIDDKTHRKPTKKDFYNRSVRYYPKAPELCDWDRDSGVYTFCNKGEKGSFPVFVCDLDTLIL